MYIIILYIYVCINVYLQVHRLPHPRRGYSQGQVFHVSVTLDDKTSGKNLTRQNQYRHHNLKMICNLLLACILHIINFLTCRLLVLQNAKHIILYCSCLSTQ